MKKPTLRRAYARLTSDLVPRALWKFGYKTPQPRGRQRPASDDYSMAVPFGYEMPAKTDRPSIAVICHLFHADLSDWLLRILRQIGPPANVYVSTDTAEKAAFISGVLARWAGGTTSVRVVENRGRDVAPKILTFADAYDRHDLILFLHSKKSNHYDFGEAWRDYLTDSLAGSSKIVNSILEIFDLCPQVGMVIAQHYEPLHSVTPIDWAANYWMSQRLAWRMDIDLSPDGYVDLPSGSMFWARPQALRPLLDLGLSLDDFPAEEGQLDMTISHCIERLFLFVCERAGFTWVKVCAEHPAASDQTVVSIDQPPQIDAFVARRRFDLLESPP